MLQRRQAPVFFPPLLPVAALTAFVVACSAPQVDDKMGQELAPEPGVDRNAAVPVRAPEPSRQADKAKPKWPAATIGTATPPDVASPPQDAIKSASGLSYKILRVGEGAMAERDSKVVAHYAGWTTKGDLFDSSVPRGEPLAIGLNQVIEGWRLGVAGMKVGEVRRLWIPEALAYKGQSGAPQGMLVFDIELLAVE